MMIKSTGKPVIKGYWTTKDLTARYRCSSRTIVRWMQREKHPFPLPRILAIGSYNRWAIDDVEEWEAAGIDTSQHAA